jgi:hypothetical protein
VIPAGVEFAALLRAAGLDPARVKLLRHDDRGRAALALGRAQFASFLSIQNARASPYRGDPTHAAHFIPGPRQADGAASALFVGLTRLLDRFPWSETRLPRLWLPGPYDGGQKPPEDDNEGSDHAWDAALADHEGRLLIDWGHAPRAWAQWARPGEKRVLAATGAAGAGAAPSLLDATARHAATLAHEHREIAAALDRLPDPVTRAFTARWQEERPAQTTFRQRLIARYGAACAITGPCPPEVLEAAHIIPFAEGHSWRDLAANGLLLRRDVHRLFDLLLLAVEPADTTVWLAPALREGPYAPLHGRRIETEAAPAALGTHARRARALARREGAEGD